jgi:hypothetical protein
MTKAQVIDPGLFAVRGDQLSRARFVPEGSSGFVLVQASRAPGLWCPARRRPPLAARRRSADARSTGRPRHVGDYGACSHGGRRDVTT